jgi:hypothetical protein
MMYAIEMASGGMVRTYISSFMKIGTGFHAIFRFLPRRFERLKCWYY